MEVSMKTRKNRFKNLECKILAIIFFFILLFYGWHERNVLKDFFTTLFADDPAKITAALGNLETEFQNHTYNKDQLVNLDGALYRLAGRTEMNDVVKLNNGHLTSVRPTSTPAPQNADSVVYMQQWLNMYGIPFLFVLSPYKICAEDPQLPAGVTDYTNEDADIFLKELYMNDVPVMDLRYELHKDELDHYDMFFKTDHHWTIESSFWAFQELATYMDLWWGLTPDPACLDLDNYTIDTYENLSLGSKGKRTGRYYAGMDDFSVIYPSFETNMSLSIPDEGIYRSGSFYDTIFVKDLLRDDDPFYLIPYDSYIGGVFPLVIHENPEAKADYTVLMIKDSFASPVEAFLSSCYTEVHCLDMRKYTGKVGDYVEEIKPDAVICFYNAQNVINAEQFWFGF